MRNGPELSAAMAEHRVVEMLLYILMNDPDVGPKVRRRLLWHLLLRTFVCSFVRWSLNLNSFVYFLWFVTVYNTVV